MRLSAGGTVSGYVLGYGNVKVLGASAFVDVDTLRHFGFEGEARWLVFHLKADQNGPAADEHAATYMIGPRYSRNYGRFQPYAKALVGFGQFNYPYNLGTDNDLVVAPGGGWISASRAGFASGPWTSSTSSGPSSTTARGRPTA
jgi:hypothetical protein